MTKWRGRGGEGNLGEVEEGRGKIILINRWLEHCTHSYGKFNKINYY
jgi:hypothetical protein